MDENNKSKFFNWNGMPEKAQQILGDDFWYEIGKLLPKKGPPIDIYKTADQIVVVLEAPGIESRDKLSVRIKGKKLNISGEIPMAYFAAEEDIIQRERFYGTFNRELVLPGDIVSEGPIDAQFRGGLVEIRIPRRPEDAEQEVIIDFNE